MTMSACLLQGAIGDQHHQEWASLARQDLAELLVQSNNHEFNRRCTLRSSRRRVHQLSAEMATASDMFDLVVEELKASWCQAAS
jgi:hypothetical protein